MRLLDCINLGKPDHDGQHHGNQHNCCQHHGNDHHDSQYQHHGGQHQDSLELKDHLRLQLLLLSDLQLLLLTTVALLMKASRLELKAPY